MIKRGIGQYVDVKGLKTFYIQTGIGHPLLLLHGASPGACALVNYGPVIDLFASAGFTVYAYDQPGYGRTDNPSDYSMEFRVAHAEEFMTALGLDRYHVLGNSMGVYIGLRLALEDSRVVKLVAVAGGALARGDSPQVQEIYKTHSEYLAAYTPSIENMRNLTSGTLYNQELVTDDLVQFRHEMSIGKNFEAQQKRKGHPPAKPLQDELPNLAVKTLIVWGKNDRGNPVERAYRAFEAIPDAELHLFDKCAHWPMWDHPKRFCTVVANFLNSSD